MPAGAPPALQHSSVRQPSRGIYASLTAKRGSTAQAGLITPTRRAFPPAPRSQRWCAVCAFPFTKFRCCFHRCFCLRPKYIRLRLTAARHRRTRFEEPPIYRDVSVTRTPSLSGYRSLFYQIQRDGVGDDRGRHRPLRWCSETIQPPHRGDAPKPLTWL